MTEAAVNGIRTRTRELEDDLGDCFGFSVRPQLAELVQLCFLGDETAYENFLEKSTLLLNTLLKLEFPIVQDHFQVVHLLEPKLEPSAGHFYFQLGRNTPGTLSLKFCKLDNTGQLVLRPSQVEGYAFLKVSQQPLMYLNDLKSTALDTTNRENMFKTCVVRNTNDGTIEMKKAAVFLQRQPVDYPKPIVPYAESRPDQGPSRNDQYPPGAAAVALQDPTRSTRPSHYNKAADAVGPEVNTALLFEGLKVKDGLATSAHIGTDNHNPTYPSAFGATVSPEGNQRPQFIHYDQDSHAVGPEMNTSAVVEGHRKNDGLAACKNINSNYPTVCAATVVQDSNNRPSCSHYDRASIDVGPEVGTVPMDEGHN